MEEILDMVQISSLIGEPSRARMLVALMGGKALTATELALEADISAQTASTHLAKLLRGGLIRVEKQGRHKYFQLNGYKIAELLENLINLSASTEHASTVTGPKDPYMRTARVCYDHLAGEYSVALLRGLTQQGWLAQKDGVILMTEAGCAGFEQLGADITALKSKRRPLCKSCLDWSERRHHLAGSIGQWILKDLFQRGWAKQDINARTVRFSDSGLRQFKRRYNL